MTFLIPFIPSFLFCLTTPKCLQRQCSQGNTWWAALSQLNRVSPLILRGRQLFVKARLVFVFSLHSLSWWEIHLLNPGIFIFPQYKVLPNSCSKTPRPAKRRQHFPEPCVPNPSHLWKWAPASYCPYLFLGQTKNICDITYPFKS